MQYIGNTVKRTQRTSKAIMCFSVMKPHVNTKESDTLDFQHNSESWPDFSINMFLGTFLSGKKKMLIDQRMKRKTMMQWMNLDRNNSFVNRTT